MSDKKNKSSEKNEKDEIPAEFNLGEYIARSYDQKDTGDDKPPASDKKTGKKGYFVEN